MESENSKMRRTLFDDYEELSDYMIDKAQDGFYTVAVLFYDDALGLLRELMRYDDVKTEVLDIEPKEYDGYDKEYYVSLADDMVVSVEPAYSDGRYLSAEADITLIHGDASSAIIKNIPDDKCLEIYIGISDYMDCYDLEQGCDDKLDNIISFKLDAKSLFGYLFNY